MPPAELALEEWSKLIEHWLGQKRKLEHLEVPLDVAQKLNLQLSEEDMTKRAAKKKIIDTEGEVIDKPAAAGETPKWKRKAFFDGINCGLVGCNRIADGYIAATKPTKSDTPKAPWYGPACAKCCTAWNPALVPVTLPQLLQGRSVSELALMLDVEIGEVQNRLAHVGAQSVVTPGMPSNGVQMQLPLANPVPQAPFNIHEQAPASTEIVLLAEEVRIPKASLIEIYNSARASLEQLKTFRAQSQADIDHTAGFLAQIKGWAKNVEEYRLKLGAPLRVKLDEIQTHYREPQGMLKECEIAAKKIIDDGMSALKAAADAAFAAAQQAYHQGNMQGVIVATQQATQADVHLPKGVTMRLVVKSRIVNTALLPPEFWTWVPDETKVKAAADAGWRSIPGCEIWEENLLGSRSA